MVGVPVVLAAVAAAGVVIRPLAATALRDGQATVAQDILQASMVLLKFTDQGAVVVLAFTLVE
jgi:hypothetical protein